MDAGGIGEWKAGDAKRGLIVWTVVAVYSKGKHAPGISVCRGSALTAILVSPLPCAGFDWIY